MSQNEAKPIFSSCEDDCDKGEEIESFVIGLAEQVDELQDAELEGDLVLLGRRAGELARKASELGYAPMFEIAQVVASACRDGKFEDAQAAMVELTEVAGRIRRGHRGSA